MANDTIFAVATPTGRSGVAILRISGPRSLAVLRDLTGKMHLNLAALIYAICMIHVKV